MTAHELYQRAESVCSEASRNILRAQLAGASESEVNRLREVYRQNELVAKFLADQSHAARLAAEGE